MNIRNRTPLIGTAAILAAALAMPAFAHNPQNAQNAQSDAATQAQSPTSATGQPAQSGASGGGASGGGQTWADVDTDSDGAISKQEAQVNAGLSQIFEQADADHSGKLTPDEYKAYVAKQQGGAAGSNGQ